MLKTSINHRIVHLLHPRLKYGWHKVYRDHVSRVGLVQSIGLSDALSIIQSVGPGAKLGEISLSIQLFLCATFYGNSPALGIRLQVNWRCTPRLDWQAIVHNNLMDRVTKFKLLKSRLEQWDFPFVCRATKTTYLLIKFIVITEFMT